MKVNKIALSVAAAMMSLPAMADMSVEYPDREFYGYFLGNAEWTNALNTQYGFGRQTFARTEKNTLMQDMSDGRGVYAACCIDGVFYAMPYVFMSSLSSPEPAQMYSYNMYTGRIEEIGVWSTDNMMRPQDMTYDIKNDRILCVASDMATGGGIYEIDRNTAEMTLVHKLGTSAGTIACDANGRVFVITGDGRLCQIDMTKDYAFETLYTLPYSGMMAKQTAEFDHTNHKLYWAANCYENPNNDKANETWLIEITLPVIGPEMGYKPDSGVYSYSQVGRIGTGARFSGLYIPYCPGGFDAPGFATDITPVSAPDGSSLTINFKTPSMTFGGDRETTVDGCEIYREGVRIGELKNLKAGMDVQYVDETVPASGTYRYDILCYSNTSGDGPKTPVYAYVGYDRPAAVGDIKVDVGDSWTEVNLSWTAPAEGAQGGTYDVAETVYDIVRLPDNVEIARDLKDVKITDSNFRRLLRYSYKITAKNAIGSTETVSEEFVAGPPVTDLPLEETFENPTAFKNRWMTYDYNSDTYSWLFGSDIGHSVFGDYEMVAEYIVSPTLCGPDLMDADEWIITPPVLFPEGGEYVAVFDIRSLTNETLNVYVGSRNHPEHMTKVGTFRLREPEYSGETSGGRMLFQKYVVALPSDIAGTVACVGLQLASQVPDDVYSYMQLGGFAVGDRSLAVESVDGDNESIRLSRVGDDLVIDGDYSHAALYTLSGAKVADVRANVVSLAGLPAGVYILNVDGAAIKLTR